MDLVCKDHIGTYSREVKNKYKGKLSDLSKRKDLERKKNMSDVKSWIARCDK